MRIVRVPVVFIAIVVVFGTAAAKDKRPKSYPQTGTVVATRLSERRVPTYGEPYGKTGVGNISIPLHIYRVQTEGRFYELEGGRKPTLSVGDSVHFRIEKDAAYVQRGDKEDKYWILRAAQKSRSDRLSPSSDPLSLR
jgi:hypothetical protein